MAALAVVVASTVSGCAGTAVKHSVDRADLAAAGAWEQEFADAIGEASEYEGSILGDGVITAAERAEAQAKVRACMADAGFDYRDHDDGTAEMQRSDGGDLPSVDRSNDVLRGCRHRFDRNVTYLHNEVRRNPEKLDEAAIAVACLRTAGLVGKGYTEWTWRAENDTGVWSFDEWDGDAVQCRLDPLGLWRNG